MPLTLIKSDPRAREKPCLRCGYSLRKVVDVKHCPECGLSIWLSLNANDSLDWSKPAWVAKLTVAAWILAVAQVIGLVVYGGILMAGMHREPRTHLLGLPGAVYALVYSAGLVLLASDEGRHPDKWQPYRWACRGVAGLGVVAAGICLSIGVKDYPPPPPAPTIPPQVQAMIDSGEVSQDEIDDAMAAAMPGTPRMFGRHDVKHHLDTVLEWFIIASTLATCAYLRKLAQRIPNGPLAKFCGWLLLLPLVSLVKSLPIVAFWFAPSLAGLIAYLPFLYLPATAVLLVRFGLLFRAATGNAITGWASETGAVA